MKRLTKKSIMLLLKSVCVIALFSVIVLNMYSEPVKAEKSYAKFDFAQLEEKNKDKWMEYCKGNYNDQSPEKQQKCYDTLTESLEKFYNKLYDVLEKYQGEGLYIEDQVILWTVFFSQFSSPSTGAEAFHVNNNTSDLSPFEQFARDYFGFQIDDSNGDDIEVNVDYNRIDPNYFAKETDTIKTLVRNAIAYTTRCYGVVGEVTWTTADDGSRSPSCPNGGSPTYDVVKENSPVCADTISTYKMGFWKFFTSRFAYDETFITHYFVKFLGLTHGDENYNDCHSHDGSYSKVHYQYDDEPKVDYDRYFDFLKENAYFDGKANLQYYFQKVLVAANVDCLMDVVCENSLESLGEEEYAKYQEMLEEKRLNIIYDILEFLDYYGIGIQYGKFIPKSDLIPGSGGFDRKAYYWPIGSDTTEERNGVVYADGEPASTAIKSYFGDRINDATNEREDHTGIDIKGTKGTTNVIAVEQGEVMRIVDNCSSGDLECNEGYGNMIMIGHSDGNFTMYALLDSIDPSVQVNGSVQKGQLIGKVGDTGRTGSAALHFEIRENGDMVDNAIDPLTLIKGSDPRPAGFAGGDFSMRKTSLTKEEFVSGLRNYCNKGSCSKGEQLFAQNAELIYDTSVANGLNPEFTVARAISEGFSPHYTCNSGSNNFWGIGCTNGNGCSVCSTYSSLEAGIKGLSGLKIVQQYESALEVFTKGHYAYIGKTWLSPGSWGDGGCIYYDHIKEYYTDSARSAQVASACSRSCSGSSCMATNDQDQEAYGYFQIRHMSKARYNIWGL